MSEYAERDIWALMNYHSKHGSAMTREGLHEKSAIAAELAYRDWRIDQLAAQVERLKEAAHSVLSDYECAINCLEHEDEAKESQHLADGLRSALNETPDQSMERINGGKDAKKT